MGIGQALSLKTVDKAIDQ